MHRNIFRFPGGLEFRHRALSCDMTDCSRPAGQTKHREVFCVVNSRGRAFKYLLARLKGPICDFACPSSVARSVVIFRKL